MPGVFNLPLIPVHLPGRSYDIRVERGLLENVGESLRRFPSSAGRCAIVTDSNVAPFYLPEVKGRVEGAGLEPVAVVLPAGELHKSIQALNLIYDSVLSAGIERLTPLLALGGGVVTDLGGFAAATLLRGLPYVPIPTSLLAMVDASVGGKTGVNHAAGKNLIGAFHQPAAVLIDPEVLKTLPPVELRNGLAEVIKHCVIRDERGFARLEERIDDALKPSIEFLTDVIAENVAIKARIVEADPHEHGERAHLNFGHTFGHAFEKASDYAIPHGQAVALGMCAACHAAMELGMIGSDVLDRVVQLIASAGLPSRTDQVDVEEALDAMALDKKVRAGRIRFVLPERIGLVVVRDDVPADVVRSAVEAVCG